MAKEILNKLRAPNNKRVSCQNGYGYNCNHITLFGSKNEILLQMKKAERKIGL